MSLYDEIRELLKSARDSTDLGAFAGMVGSIAEPDDGVFVGEDEFRLLVLAMLSAQSDAILRVARRVEELSSTVTQDHEGE